MSRKSIVKSELVLTEILSIADDLKCSFFDATIEFCERNDLQPGELVEQLDPSTIQFIKNGAIEEGRLRKKFISTLPSDLSSML